MDINEFGYFAKTVADQVGISTDVLRKRSGELELLGVTFKKDKDKNRTYSDNDIRMFQVYKQQRVDLKRPLSLVLKHLAEEWHEHRFEQGWDGHHEEITPSVSQRNHEDIMPKSRTDEFKSELISEMRDMMQTELSALVQHIVQQPKQIEMLPNNSKQHQEMLQRILDSVQTLQEVSAASLHTPTGENTSEDKLNSLEANFERLVNAHTLLLSDFKVMQQKNSDLERKNSDLQRTSELFQQENEALRKELAEKAKKGWWRFGK